MIYDIYATANLNTKEQNRKSEMSINDRRSDTRNHTPMDETKKGDLKIKDPRESFQNCTTHLNNLIGSPNNSYISGQYKFNQKS